MPSLHSKRLYIAGCGLFALGIVVGAALAPRVLAPAPVTVDRGVTLAHFAPDAILSVTYTTRSSMTTAQRSNRGARFHVQSTFADERPVQHCSAPADLAGHLVRFADLKARRGLSFEQRDREFPFQLGVLDIRDNATGEPAASAVLFANRDGSSVAVTLEGYAGEVVLPVAELRWLEQACDTVALSEEPAPDDKSASLVPGGAWITTTAPYHPPAPPPAPAASPR